jgi:hypothetical protein
LLERGELLGLTRFLPRFGRRQGAAIPQDGGNDQDAAADDQGERAVAIDCGGQGREAHGHCDCDREPEDPFHCRDSHAGILPISPV